MNDPLNQEFVRLMAESGWTAEQCADVLGVTRGAVSQYRNGHTRPSITVLRLFSLKCGIPLTLSGEKPSVMRDGPPALEPWETLALNSLRLLKPPVRKRFLDLMDEMLTTSPPQEHQTKTPVVPALGPKSQASAPRGRDRTAKPASAVDPSKDPTVEAFVSAIAAESTAVALRSLGLPPTPVSPTASNASPSSPSHPAKGASPKPTTLAPTKRVAKK